MLPEVDAMCHVFGNDDSFRDPWTADRQPLDEQYVYAYWREAVCCPEPRPSGAVAMVSIPIVKVPLDIELIN